MLFLDHVALAVRDLEACAGPLRDLGFPLGPVEEQDSENTREVYLEISPVSVLLVQPRSEEGPIARHMARRGPGFHHVAFRTQDLSAVLAKQRDWWVCPATLRNLPRGGPAWLLRRDLGLLLEIVPAPAGVVPKGPNLFRNLCMEVPDPQQFRSQLEDLGATDERRLVLRPGRGRISHVELEIGDRGIVVDSLGALSFSG